MYKFLTFSVLYFDHFLNTIIRYICLYLILISFPRICIQSAFLLNATSLTWKLLVYWTTLNSAPCKVTRTKLPPSHAYYLPATIYIKTVEINKLLRERERERVLPSLTKCTIQPISVHTPTTLQYKMVIRKKWFLWIQTTYNTVSVFRKFDIRLHHLKMFNLDR